MNLKTLLILYLISLPVLLSGQVSADTNKTDQQGRKQGLWIKKYPGKITMYVGYFKNDKPVGEFKRFYEDSKLKSVLIYSEDGKKASATMYHENGLISSKGNYINQKKEGKWQFFSQYIDGYLICEEFYTNNLRNGLSLRFYPDSTLAEKVNYLNDAKNGECIQYHPNGKVCMKTTYSKGKINGKYNVWADNGRIEISGQYINDTREGRWLFYNKDSSVKYDITYTLGVPNNHQMEIDESRYLDSLERNKGKIADPEKVGRKW
jgi:antitoxin component YwqK of YwqJK toxin-antitoxin module